MAIAHGSEILGAVNTATPYDTAITPAATPNGVCVIIICGAVTDFVTSVTYGTGAGASADGGRPRIRAAPAGGQ